MNQRYLVPHRSVRQFKPDPVPEELVQELLREAQRAPTDATAQMYSLVRIKDRKLRLALSAGCGGVPPMEAAPEFFVICADLARLRLLLSLEDQKLGDFPAIGLHFATVDATLVAQRLMDAAEAAGLGVCPIGALANGIEEVVRLLQLPPLVMPLFGLCLGYPQEEPPERPRLPLSLVLFTDAYGLLPSAVLKEASELMNPITRSGHWLGILSRYFAERGTMEERETAWRKTLRAQGFRFSTEG